MLHRHTDLLDVPRLEEVFVGSRVETLCLETCAEDVRQFPPLVVRVPNNSLKDALASGHFSIVHGVAAQLNKKVIDSCMIWRLLHVLDEVNLEYINK